MILLQSPLKHLKAVVGIPKGGGNTIENLMRKSHLGTFKFS